MLTTSRMEVLSKDRVNSIFLPVGSLRLPGPIMDVHMQTQKLVEANLAKLPVDQLQLIQQWIDIKLRDRELTTYNKNVELIQQNVELTAAYQTRDIELRQYKEKE